MVNGILSSYARKAKEAGVEYTAQADTPVQSPIADVDFVAILANLLENALNACVKINSPDVYKRQMASTVAPTEEEKRDLYNLSNNIPFDDRVNHNANMEDLNITLIQNYLKEVGSSLFEASKKMDFVDLCKSMNIISSLPEYTKPKNVGLMFFCLNPEKFFPYAQIDVVEFPDDLGGDKIIEKTFKGPLHQQLREALLYIQNSVCLLYTSRCV